MSSDLYQHLGRQRTRTAVRPQRKQQSPHEGHSVARYSVVLEISGAAALSACGSAARDDQVGVARMDHVVVDQQLI